MDSGDLRSLQVAAAMRDSALLADSIAATFERVAGTYRRMADTAGSPDRAGLLLAHAARLEERAEDERAAAERWREELGQEAV